MKRILSILAALAAVTGLSVSCSDISSLEKEIDELGTRVDALENQVKELNESILLLSKLEKATTIQKVTPDGNGGFTIIFADGAEYHITPGAKGDTGKVPVMSIRNGEWYVDYQDGKGPQSLGVKATGENGKTPEFRVYKGVWQMRYVEDGPEAEYRNVKDAEGNDVPATTEGSGAGSFSGAEISEDGTMFIVTVPTENGERQISLPIVPDFYVMIKENTELIKQNEYYMFEAGGEASFDVAIGNAENLKISCPEGWNAYLDDLGDTDQTTYRLTVIAPKAQTKAIVADTRSDVTIQAISASYGTAQAKISVLLSDSKLEFNPTATITAGEATLTSLTFSIALSQANKFKYILLKANATAPEITDFEALTAIEGSQPTFVVDKCEGEELLDGESYIIYVLPFQDDKAGEITSMKHETIMGERTLYETYMRGQDLVIEGKIFNLATHGPAMHITSDYTLSGSALPTDDESRNIHVFFVEPEATFNFNYTGSCNTLLIIGNNPEKQSKFVMGATQIKANTIGNDLINGNTPQMCIHLHNLDFNASAVTAGGIMVANYNGEFDYIGLTKCKITTKKSMFYNSDGRRSIKEIFVKDCDFRYEHNGSGTDFNFIGTGSSAVNENPYRKLTFINNIFYCPSGSAVYWRFVTGNDVYVEDIVLKNNTFVNMSPNGGGKGAGYFCTTSAKSINTADNLFYNDVLDLKVTILKLIASQRESWPDNATVYANLTGDCPHNAVYAPKVTSDKAWAITNGSTGNIINAEMTMLDADPFEGGTFNLTDGIFIPAEAYKSYGAQR